MELFSKTEIIVMASILAFILLVIIVLTILDIIDERKSRKQNVVEKEEIEQEVNVVEQKEEVVAPIALNTNNVETVQIVENNQLEVNVDNETFIIEEEQDVVEIEEIEVLDFDEPIIEMKEELTNNVVNIVESVEVSKVEEVSSLVQFQEFAPVEDESNILVIEDEQERAKEELRRIEEELEKQESFENTITNFEIEQEENAIISYDELIKVSDKLYDQNQVVQYDDGDEPITIDEVIKRFSSSDMVFENTADYDKLNRAVEGNDKNLVESYKSE